MNDRIVGRLTTLKGTKNPFEIHLYDWGLFAVATQISIFEGTGFSCSWCEEGWEGTNYLQCGWKLSLPLHLWTYSISFPSTAIYSAGKGGLRNLKRGNGWRGTGEWESQIRIPDHHHWHHHCHRHHHNHDHYHHSHVWVDILIMIPTTLTIRNGVKSLEAQAGPYQPTGLYRTSWKHKSENSEGILSIKSKSTTFLTGLTSRLPCYVFYICPLT